MDFLIFLGIFLLICDHHSSLNPGEESCLGSIAEFNSTVRYKTFLKESPTIGQCHRKHIQVYEYTVIGVSGPLQRYIGLAQVEGGSIPIISMPFEKVST